MAKKKAKTKTRSTKKKTTTKKVAKKKATTKKTAKKKVASPRTVNPKITLTNISLQIGELRREVSNLTLVFKKWIEQMPTDVVADGAGLETTGTQVETQPDLFDTPQNTTPANGQSTVTKEQVTQTLQKVATEHGMEKCEEILKDFGANRVSDLVETDYANFVAKCEQVSTTTATQSGPSFLS